MPQDMAVSCLSLRIIFRCLLQNRSLVIQAQQGGRKSGLTRIIRFLRIITKKALLPAAAEKKREYPVERRACRGTC